jgi:hypothetical protein
LAIDVQRVGVDERAGIGHVVSSPRQRDHTHGVHLSDCGVNIDSRPGVQ